MSATPEITLREITAATVRQVTDLAVSPEQRRFVADNAVSLAEALFAPEAWYRAIYAGDELAGFVMLFDGSRTTPPAEAPEIGVWRFMVDQRFQRRGIGEAALRLVVALVRERGIFRTLKLTYVPGPGAPEPFYRGLGFVPTGKVEDGEIEMELRLVSEGD